MTTGICRLTVSDDLMRSTLGFSGFERDIDGYHGGVISNVVINLISRKIFNDGSWNIVST